MPAGSVVVPSGRTSPFAQYPTAYRRSSCVSREKKSRSPARSSKATSWRIGSSTVVAIRLARRSRSFTNHRTVRRSTSGIIAEASTARTRRSGRTNRSESLIVPKPSRWHSEHGPDRGVAERALRQYDLAQSRRSRRHELAFVMPLAIREARFAHRVDPSLQGSRQVLDLDVHVGRAVDPSMVGGTSTSERLQRGRE